jgi:hypothetical protein
MKKDNKITVFKTETAIGRNKLFWKIDLIESSPIKIILKDKDLIFDDLIG